MTTTINVNPLESVAAQAVAYSMRLNPRNLEYYVYPDLAQLAKATIPEDASIHVACQHPIWISTKAMSAAESRSSINTESDGSATGVLVDIATVAVSLSLHPSVTIPPQYKTLGDLLKDVRDSKFSAGARFFSASIETTSMWEVKHGPLRHPKTLRAYVRSLDGILNSARAQSLGQGTHLYASPRYAEQDLTYLAATAGNWLSFREFKRSDAVKVFEEEGQVWRKIATDAKYILIGPTAKEDIESPESEWDEPDEPDELVHPEKAKTTKKQQEKNRAEKLKHKRTLADALRKLEGRTPNPDKKQQTRAQRHETLSRKRENDPAMRKLGETKPNPDRTKPLFSDMDINKYFQYYHGNTNMQQLIETRPAEEFFAGENTWSGLVRAGTAVGNSYLQHVFDFHMKVKKKEEDRRNKLLRHPYALHSKTSR
ncbi:hypothetical protein GGX14DRAFT_559890 [Mycena pura]|uniref:Uncharacterized protein n=1 Tax=Mycena pura TaxID=153505 RepID=A0AAD6VUC4_9AGAR|nr:hypothetical protein GGX14DRAFT_559890 [Mycena pura]